ncbi:MAG: hypothetical protein K6F37_03090 [Lachnospiraceae bacterium]|nr:hypothetical protein [Lachnospiraceae bacterium]
MEIAKILKTSLAALVVILVLAFAAKTFLTTTAYPEYEAEDISRIVVKDTTTLDELVIANPEDMEKIVGILSGMKLKACGAGIVTPENSYEVTLYNSDNLEIVKFNPIIITEDNKIQHEPLSYAIQGDVDLYGTIKELFETAVEIGGN